MTILATFAPAYGTGQTVASGATSESAQFTSQSKTLCITDLNGVQSYVRVGTSGVAATTADYPIPLNGQVTISKDQKFDYVAYITPAGGGSLHIMEGEGF